MPLNRQQAKFQDNFFFNHFNKLIFFSNSDHLELNQHCHLHFFSSGSPKDNFRQFGVSLVKWFQKFIKIELTMDYDRHKMQSDAKPVNAVGAVVVVIV